MTLLDFDFYTEIMRQEQAHQPATAIYAGKLVTIINTWTDKSGCKLVTIQMPDNRQRTVYASQVEVCRG